MATLTVKGVQITLSAIENSNSTYTLTGKYSSGSFDFQLANDPDNPQYNGNAIEITIPSSQKNSPIEFTHTGDPSDLWVWASSDITTDVIGDPTTPRGTKVIVSKPPVEIK
ncbi:MULTISPECIES: hypothetical protein [unclassified Tenacibaculum]|uniref:hypothetical protein n=1 Tax=unclassified Tenacibaculum TaxID=2635139 RepID=UPI001F1B51D8|nr:MULTISPECIES: hypothetical protein [unclassified Tenacibaculum]MCF2873567.1 hypothetical protein [Tenacibaculum sp. Cn5-1]MCF2933723.1 hypothetical protein [Tenacibaculum sp. Cn5-34]MCG7509695.1 hypothetical protein [Tenacibaculum sp. Cn5-46]